MTNFKAGDKVFCVDYRFDLVTNHFNLNTSPWFIKFDSEDELNLIKDWLVENGFTGNLDTILLSHEQEVSNVGRLEYDRSFAVSSELYTTRDWNSCNGVPEIKLNFKTVIDSAVFPELKSAKDLEIERIQNEMQKLQADLEKLKGD